MAHKKKLFNKLHLLWMIPCGVIALLGIIVIFPEPQQINGFRTLDEIKDYANTLDESVEAENDNVLYPRFNNYYKMHTKPSLSKKFCEKFRFILSKFGLVKASTFSTNFFNTILTNVTAERLSKHRVSPFIQQTLYSQDSVFIIVGELQGAFHSLVRNLTELKKLNLVDNNLKLINQKTFLIFLGEAVVRSPFGAETLSLLLRLIHNNPDNVIYLRGRDEHYLAWRKQSLKKELELQANWLSTDKDLFINKVNEFFQTLPYAFYITNPSSDDVFATSVIRITPKLEDEKIKNLIDEKILGDFLNQKNSGVTQMSLNNVNPNPTQESKIRLTAVISAVGKKYGYEKTRGLSMLPPIDNAVRWSVLSCPTLLAQKALNFFYDAFAILYPTDNLGSWNIDLHSRDIRSTDSAYNVQKFNLFQNSRD